jgi:hypothetical protein
MKCCCILIVTGCSLKRYLNIHFVICSEVISRTRGVVEVRTTHEREVRCSNPGVSKVLQAIAAIDGE